MTDSTYTTAEVVPEPEFTHLPEHLTIVARFERVTMEGIREHFDGGFRRLAGVLAEHGILPTGAAFAHYDREPSTPFTLEVGFPVGWEHEGLEFAADAGVALSRLPGGRVARLSHVGGYEGLGAAWGRLGAFVAREEARPIGGFWEVYVTEPTPGADPAAMRTDLFMPVHL